MHSAINATKLVLLLGFGLAYFLGLGWLAVGPLLHGSLTSKKRDIPLLHEIPLMLLSGLMLNFGIVLCLQSLNISLVVGSILSLIGAGCLVRSVFQDPTWRMPKLAMINTCIGIAFVCSLFLSPIFSEPLSDWDARSIWFFHAKMIYTAGSIGPSAGWIHPSVGFSHADYPKLVPALAAQVAQVMNYWNEYLPKTALFFMLVPGIVWLFTFARRSVSYVLLLLLFPFVFSKLMWNGYMDGYLALYFCIALLLLGRYVQSSQSIDLISSIGCFIALLSIKNEGALAALTGLSVILLIGFQKNKSYSVKNCLSRQWKYALAGFIALIPYFLWNIYTNQWNFPNNLGIGSTQSFLRITSRLADGSLNLILRNVYQQIEGALLVLGFVFFATAVGGKIFVKESLPAILVGGMYCLGMILFYLVTPYDLAWQLSMSVDRTMLSVNGSIFIASYYILSKFEYDGVGQIEVVPKIPL